MLEIGVPLWRQAGNRSMALSRRTSAFNREEKQCSAHQPPGTTTHWEQTFLNCSPWPRRARHRYWTASATERSRRGLHGCNTLSLCTLSQRFFWNSFKQAHKNETNSHINSSPEQETSCLSLDFALPAAPHAVNCCCLTQKEGWWETKIAIDDASAFKRRQIFRTLRE